MANLNVLITSRGGNVCRISQNPVKGTVKKMIYEPAVSSSVTGSNRINCLSVIVITMQQLKDSGFSDTKDIATIHTLGLVSDMIHNGTFKHWLNGDHKKLDGSEVNETEIQLWTAFIDLYKELFMNVNFKNISGLSLPKNSRIKVSQEQIALSKLSSMAWESVTPAEPELEEGEGL